MATQPPKGQSPKSAREKAAEARAAAEAADKRRRTIINVAIGAVVVLVVAAIIGGALLFRPKEADPGTVDAAAVQPQGAFPVDSPYKGGIPVAGEAAAWMPTLEIWEDFQCPGCGSFEQTFGSTVREIAQAGDATVIWRMASFLDRQFPGQNSQRAANAWGCAIDGGKAVEYHDLVFANQPAQEGDGWTDEQLLGFGTEAGLSGDAQTTFEQCVANRTYFPWAANGTVWMTEAGVPSTPGLYLNGEKLPESATASPEALRQAVRDAQGASPSPSQ